ncbi:MAG: hypothetical protein RLZZ618_3493 [Pseudomonadota bacterium]|jgi:two-component system sensor histidine kinase BaeS
MVIDSTPPSAASTAPPARRRLRWPARLDTLRIKLFLAIAGANALLALVAFVVFSWSFDQGFVEYLNRADEARLQPFIVRLADIHRREGSWKSLADDRRRWMDLTREVFGGPRGARRGDDAASGASAPQSGSPASAPALMAAPMAPAASGGSASPPDPFLTIDPRFMLFDADRKIIAGRVEMAAEAVLKPIESEGVLRGHLGYVPRLRTVTSLEKLFAAQQTAKFGAIAVGLLVAGLLVSALLAYWLARRIRRLAQGADALIQGHYSVRIASQGHDELARLAQDFNQLAQTLEAAQQARQQWIADIAHELRTPLAVLRAEIEAMQDGVRQLGQASLGSLAQEVGQLSRLVDDLRLLSLSDMGALTYYKEPLDLGALIEDSVQSSHQALNAKGIAADLSLAEGVRVLGDGARLAQVFGNLLQNTVRYTDGPGRLSVSLSNGLVRGQPRATVVWQDSSPGVDAADLPRLTERLFRVESSRSRAGGGSGLGLAITRAIVQAHGGELRASASALGGVCWTLVFPALDSGAAHG